MASIAPTETNPEPAAGRRREAFSGTLRAGSRRVIDALLPPRCLACAGAVDAQGQLCASCWQGISFIADPVCACCGLPFDFAVGEGHLCGACLARAPDYQRARAVMRYDEHSRGLILAFKHADRLDAAPGLARWCARAGAEMLASADLIAPVPLHRFRLWRRRYNQAAVLALALGQLAKKPVVADLLRRVRATPSQGGLSAEQRRRNVRGAFAVRRRHAPLLAAKRVLLIDDVMTTGATVEACARELLAQGAAAIDVLTIARVVQARPGAI